ncbi:hypothetical protein ACE01N_08205 [Saccharicrinis sp. FJH2]|uniref:hypothetical protein n=1 Tax=Saccharicrinis sp. FJH65 TaxID=3344659 RepID=UPI0035F4A05D
MKKNLLKITALAVALVLLDAQIQAANLFSSYQTDSEISDFFDFNENEIYAEFENFETSSNDNNLNDLAAILPVPNKSENYTPDDAFGIPSFLWGCIGGVTGIILVKVITEDNGEARKAFTGCVVTYALAGAMYAIYIVGAVNQ